MIRKTVTIKNPTGLHARPAAGLVQKANAFPCAISLVKDDKKANAKSIVSIMALSVGQHDRVTVITEGEGETDALQAVVAFLESLVE